MTAKNIVELKGIRKRYFEGKENEPEVLHGIDLSVREGEFVSIVGASGSGKSTLMNIVGALDRASEGRYLLNGIDIADADDTELSRIRNDMIGFVFQTYNLIPRMSALKNVELPLLYAGIRQEERLSRAAEMLSIVGMSDRINHRPEELSGGQKQRVAIARALVNNPSLILADEPTGALDSVTGRLIMDLFHELHDARSITIMLITHSPKLSEETDRIFTMSDGLITGERKGTRHA